MSFKNALLLFISFLYMYSLSEVLIVNAAGKDVVLIYATSNQQMDEDLEALHNMLAAYTEVEVIPVEEVQEKTLEEYSRLVFYSSYEMQIPRETLHALNRFQGPAIAIGRNAQQLAPFASWQKGEEVELRKIGEHILPNPIRWDSIQPTGNTEVIQKAASFTTEYPFIIKAQKYNWAYIGMLVQTMPLQYEWPNIIGDLLQLQHPETHKAFIAVTDVNMKTDVVKLKEVVERFLQYGIPISLEVTPQYEDEKEDTIYFLQDNKPLLKYLQQLQQEGFSFILSSSSVEQSLNYLVLRNIYPILTTEENPLFSGAVSRQTKHIYSTEIGNRVIYPYTVLNIENNEVSPLYQFESSINRLYKAPGSTIGIQYPAYLGTTYIQELVEILNGKGQVEWLDFRKTEQHIQTKKVSIIQTKNGEQKVKLSFTFLDRLKIQFEEEPFVLILWLLVIIVSIFVAVFFLNSLLLRITLRKRLFEERKSNG